MTPVSTNTPNTRKPPSNSLSLFEKEADKKFIDFIYSVAAEMDSDSSERYLQRMKGWLEKTTLIAGEWNSSDLSWTMMTTNAPWSVSSRGDELTLNDLMARWKEPLVTYCLRYTGNITDAKEIAQESFVKVYQSRHRYEPRATAFSTWLFQIATNLCRMRNRWKNRHPELLEADAFSSAPQDSNRLSESGIPSDEADRRSLATDLDAAIRLLQHDLRTTFILSPKGDHIGRSQSSRTAPRRRSNDASPGQRKNCGPCWKTDGSSMQRAFEQNGKARVRR